MSVTAFEHPLAKYIRPSAKSTANCPGCGNGILAQAILQAIDELGLSMDDFVFVSGIGCSAWIPSPSFYADVLHTTHGRPIAFATGVKLAKPSLTVIVITGDGDALAIGGNHFIHAARRNLDMTVLLFNNATYGMTGGQLAPTTPTGKVATTARYASIDPPFDACTLAIAAGATYVARGTSYHSQQLDRLIEGGIKHKGFALIEILENCNTYYGRPNKISLMELLQWEKDNTVNVKAAERMTPEQLQGKIITGLLYQADRPEYVAEYEQHIARVQAKAGVAA